MLLYCGNYSVLMYVCMCVLIYEHDNLTMHGRKIMKFAINTEYENISDEFDI